MSILFILLIVSGLIICFGGIYIRIICSGMTGFLNGALSTIFFIFVTFGIFKVADEKTLYIVLFVGILCCVLSVVQEKLCAFVNGFIPTFIAVSVALCFISYSEDIEGSLIIVFAVIAGLIAGGISVSVYNYAYMLETAFTGAFLASVGVCGIIDEAVDLVDIVFLIAQSEDYIGGIISGTIILGIIGFAVQLHRFNTISSKTKSEDRDSLISGWQCVCGYNNTSEEVFCNQCGKKRFVVATTSALGNEWECSCGNFNHISCGFCSNCGKEKNTVVHLSSYTDFGNRIQRTWNCSCGATQPYENRFCSECGKERNMN